MWAAAVVVLEVFGSSTVNNKELEQAVYTTLSFTKLVSAIILGPLQEARNGNGRR